MLRANTQVDRRRLHRYTGISASVAAARSGVDVALVRCSSEGDGVMSQAAVGMVVEKLLTDEELRIQFALDRVETIADLCLRGFDLNPGEIDLFYRTDAGLWFLRSALRDARQH
jgi:hypothetical protein